MDNYEMEDYIVRNVARVTGFLLIPFALVTMFYIGSFIFGGPITAPIMLATDYDIGYVYAFFIYNAIGLISTTIALFIGALEPDIDFGLILWLIIGFFSFVYVSNVPMF